MSERETQGASRAPLEIEILNWDKFNPRKDVKNATWLKLSNRIFEDPDFYDFNHGEILVWIYLLSLASRARKGTVRLNYAHAERVARLPRRLFDTAIEKLVSLQIVKAHVREENPNFPNAYASETPTLQTRTPDKRREDKKRGEESGLDGVPYGTPTPVSLVEIWNSHSGNLPKVKECRNTRLNHATARWRERPDEVFWISVVKRVALSPFCCGDNDRKWRADFDWLIKPETAGKVTEGKYDARSGPTLTPMDPELRKEIDEFQAEIARAMSQMDGERL